MGKTLVESQYYVVENVGESVIDGQLQAEFVVRDEVWSGVYGDCLVNTEILFKGTGNEVITYLDQNGIDNFIGIGI